MGVLRARFCIYGDTVNTASRMESSGRPGCCQLSGAAYAACALPPNLLPPHRVEIKGKGMMVTHILQTGMEAEAAVRRALSLPPRASAATSGVRHGTIAARWRKAAAAALRAARAAAAAEAAAAAVAEASLLAVNDEPTEEDLEAEAVAEAEAAESRDAASASTAIRGHEASTGTGGNDTGGIYGGGHRSGNTVRFALHDALRSRASI